MYARFDCCIRLSFETDLPIMILQLRRSLAKDGGFNDHAFVSIVRLTVETNLVTSKSSSF
jgi:hypothetical protein